MEVESRPALLFTLVLYYTWRAIVGGNLHLKAYERLPWTMQEAVIEDVLLPLAGRGIQQGLKSINSARVRPPCPFMAVPMPPPTCHRCLMHYSTVTMAAVHAEVHSL